jgi:methionine-rich copper-binding protein CopC
MMHVYFFIKKGSNNNKRERKVRGFSMKTLHRYTQALFAALLSLGLLFIIAGTASAHTNHAKVLSATPAIGSTIAQAPTKVTVECAENINPNPKLSNLFVYGPSGELISQGNATVSLSNPKEMSIGIKSDGNGVYVVRWITVSAADGDPDQGAFVFTVKPAVTTAPTPTGNSTTTTNSTPASSGTPLWATILIGFVALLVGLGAGLGIGRSRTKPAASTLSAMRREVAAQEEPKTPTRPS